MRLPKTNIEKHVEYMSQFKYKCKCGHNVYLSNRHPVVVCSWCGNSNYLDKKQEFKENLKKALKK